MKVFTLLLLTLTSALSFGQTPIQNEIDAHFTKVGFNWKKVSNHFLERLKEWDFVSGKVDFNSHLHKFYSGFDQIVQPIEKTESTNEIIAEFEKLGDFHPEGEFGVGKTPTAWWQDILKNVDRDNRYNAELFNYLKKRSIEGGIHPSIIASVFSIGFTPDQLKDKGLQKLSVCILYPFLLPSPANLASQKAEEELKALMEPMLEKVDWEAFETDLLNHIATIPDYSEEDFFRKGDKFHLMFSYISATNGFVPLESDLLDAIEAEEFIGETKPNFAKIAELLKPILDENPELHKFHPIRGAYHMADDIKEAGGIGPGVVAEACKINWNEVIIEEPHHLLLSIIFLSKIILK